MRILIEIDGAEKAAATTAALVAEVAEDVSPATDGGAAPETDRPKSAAQSNDGGGPSPDLVAAIRAAEASGMHSGNEADFPADASDGGGAPSVDADH